MVESENSNRSYHAGGRPFADVLPPSDDTAVPESLYGFMVGSVLIPGGYDLTAPLLQEPLDAREETLHR